MTANKWNKNDIINHFTLNLTQYCNNYVFKLKEYTSKEVTNEKYTNYYKVFTALAAILPVIGF